MTVQELATLSASMIEEVERAIVGKRETVEMAVLTLICNGHLLIEDIPGVGKTTLSKALARTLGGEFRRMQFTPDLLPADITGSNIYNQAASKFEFVPGPIFANVALVDEINRATPKTQSALLEAMEERQVSSDGVSRPLPKPFFVIATQNTVEMTGTYPLPEAQLDRFLVRVAMGYPEKEDEVAMLENQRVASPIETVRSIVTPEKLIEMQETVRGVFVRDILREYVVDIVRATRNAPQLLMGASPRGSIFVMRAAQAHAAMRGREEVYPEDVKAVVPAVLGHRVIPRADVRQKSSVEAALTSMVATIPAPTLRDVA